jgi:hypothetical protein
MTKEALQNWLVAWHPPSSTLAAAILFGDRSIFVKQAAAHFSEGAISQSLRSIVETYRVLALHRSTAQWMCFDFDEARLFTAFRTDGHCLGLILPSDESEFGSEEFATVAEEFLKAAARPQTNENRNPTPAKR